LVKRSCLPNDDPVTVRSLGELTPQIHPDAWVSEAAYVVGDVVIGEGSSVWPGAVLRGDFGAIHIGTNTHVEDNCVVHADGLLEIGDDVIVGHSVVIHCRSIGSRCLVGSHATLLDDSVIGDRCLVAAGSLVLGKTMVDADMFIAGAPAKVRPATEQQLWRLDQMVQRDRGYGAMTQRYKQAGL
jgi:carbonic anhydrase/acetyltransferase-like protein (isoleucine patch superfamily)